MMSKDNFNFSNVSNDISLEIKEEEKQSLGYYYCPICLNIPSIQYFDEYVKIKCSCGILDGEKNQGENEDITKPEILKEFVEYKEYKLLLKSYNQICEINSKKNLNCEIKINHSEDKPTDIYCIDCDGGKFICNKCLELHDQKNKNHIQIISNGLKIKKNCEIKDCNIKGLIQFYCKDCQMHLCSECKLKHDNSHSIIDLELLYKNEKFNLDDIEIIDLTSYISKLYKLIETIESEYVIKECKKLINNYLQNNKEIETFITTLYNTYKNTSNLLNYNIIHNLISNDINEILLNKYDQLINLIKSKASIYSNELNQIENSSMIKFKYENINIDLELFDKDIHELNSSKIITENNDGDDLDCITIYKFENNYLLAHITDDQYSKNIEIIDIKTNKIVKVIKNAHSLRKLKHYYNRYNKTHFLISVDFYYTITLWNINKNYENILTIENKGSKYVSIFMIIKKDGYYIGKGEFNKDILQIYNSEGNLKETLKMNCILYNDTTETYYINNIIYLLMSTSRGIILYDYTNKVIKHKLLNDTRGYYYSSIIIYINNKLTIVDSDENGYITFFDFNNGNVMHRIIPEGYQDIAITDDENQHIEMNEDEDGQIRVRGRRDDFKGIECLCLWNNHYLISCGDHDNLSIYDLRTYKHTFTYKNLHHLLLTVKKLKLDNSEEILITVGDNKIILHRAEK